MLPIFHDIFELYTDQKRTTLIGVRRNFELSNYYLPLFFLFSYFPLYWSMTVLTYFSDECHTQSFSSYHVLLDLRFCSPSSSSVPINDCSDVLATMISVISKALVVIVFCNISNILAKTFSKPTASNSVSAFSMCYDYGFDAPVASFKTLWCDLFHLSMIWKWRWRKHEHFMTHTYLGSRQFVSKNHICSKRQYGNQYGSRCPEIHTQGVKVFPAFQTW